MHPCIHIYPFNLKNCKNWRTDTFLQIMATGLESYLNNAVYIFKWTTGQR